MWGEKRNNVFSLVNIVVGHNEECIANQRKNSTENSFYYSISNVFLSLELGAFSGHLNRTV